MSAREVDLRPVDTGSPHWRSQAVCSRHPEVTIEDFFPEGKFRKNSREYRKHIAFLRSLCSVCSVVDECRAEAERWGCKEGFWAGETASERKHRRFPATRPGASRKDPMAEFLWG